MAKSVLVVDDNPAIRDALCRLFTSEEFQICGQAENGQAAISRAQELHPDLIVIDISMPVMNGIEAAWILRKLLPATPVIAFSEYSDALPHKIGRSTGLTAVSKSEHTSVLLSRAWALVFDNAA
jgi:CheY-like chemotaxis protein